ncbi:Gfo/Idh/MocA family protein [Propionibacteriaceae bacterium Y2011]
MSGAVRVGLLGAGGIARAHARAFTEAGAAVVAVSDPVAEAARTLAQDHDAEVFPSPDGLLTRGGCDVVVIATPPVAHADLAVLAARRGVAMLIEKPMAYDVTGAERIVTAVEEAGVLATVGFCHRFEPAVVQLRALLAEGRIGAVKSFRNRFSGEQARMNDRWYADPAISGGGTAVDTSVHSIDLFRHLVGDVVQVHAVTSTGQSAYGPPLAVEDTSMILLKSTAGATGVLEASWRTAPAEATITVSGETGRLHYDYLTGVLELAPAEGEVERFTPSGTARFVGQAAGMIAAVRDDAPLRTTVADGLAANRVLAQAYASAGPLSN